MYEVKKEAKLIRYSDSVLASCQDDIKSTSRYI